MDGYFADIDRLDFDVATLICRGHSYEEVAGPLSDVYRKFADMALSRGVVASLGINPYHCRKHFLSESEFQHHRDNRPAELHDGFFASFASTEWREQLKRLISLFVQDFGYSMVLIGEPIYGVDIPGSRDRMYEEFGRKCPDLPFPELREETASYLSLQKLKADVLIDLCDELSSHAKSVGAEKVGVMTRPFTAKLAEACGALEIPRCCDNGRLISLPAIDYAIVRTAPDAAECGELPNGDAAITAYAEVMANTAGKGVIAVTQAPGPSGNPRAINWMPKGIHKATVAGFGAAPCGMVFIWRSGAASRDSQYDALVSLAKETLPRMIGNMSSGSIVYSHSGTWHDSATSADAWSHYWSLARYLIEDCHWPIPTVSSETIDSLQDSSPYTRSLLLEEHSPLTPEQVASVLRWWKNAPGRSIIVVGNGIGLSANPLEPGPQPVQKAFPGLLENFGLKPREGATITRDAGSKLRLKAAGCAKPMLPPDGTEVAVDAIASVEKVFGSGCRVLYSDDEGNPIITSWQEGDRAAYFCGLGASDATASIIVHVIQHVAASSKLVPPPITNVSGRAMWNATAGGYAVVANSSDEPAHAMLAWPPAAYWDVIGQELIRDESVDLKLEPGDIRVLRWIPKTAKLIDVVRAVYIHSTNAGAGRADVDLDVRPETAFIVRTPPKKVFVDGLQTSDYSVGRYSSFTKVTLDGLNPGRHVVTMSW